LARPIEVRPAFERTNSIVAYTSFRLGLDRGGSAICRATNGPRTEETMPKSYRGQAPGYSRPSAVEILERKTVFQGYFRMDRYRLRHETFAGGMSAPIVREVLERGHAAGVLLFDPRRDAVVLIEQFRIGALAAGRDPWVIEIAAGMVEPGEAPDAVARREATEEAGVTVRRMVPISDLLLSAGVLSETFVLYCGEIDAGAAGGLHGLAEEGEDIRAELVPVRTALALLRTGRIANAPAVIALQWLALNRRRLRREWLAAPSPRR
jgi:ADP-ribose pyrophosphatase